MGQAGGLTRRASLPRKVEQRPALSADSPIIKGVVVISDRPHSERIPRVRNLSWIAAKRERGISHFARNDGLEGPALFSSQEFW